MNKNNAVSLALLIVCRRNEKNSYRGQRTDQNHGDNSEPRHHPASQVIESGGDENLNQLINQELISWNFQAAADGATLSIKQNGAGQPEISNFQVLNPHDQITRTASDGTGNFTLASVSSLNPAICSP